MTKTYGEKVLFQNINLQVNKNQKVGLVAKNGSGKSTLLKVVAGLEKSEGEQARMMMHRDARVGFLFQDPEFNPNHIIIEAALDADNPAFKAIKAYEEALLQSDNETVLGGHDPNGRPQSLGPRHQTKRTAHPFSHQQSRTAGADPFGRTKKTPRPGAHDPGRSRFFDFR